MPKHQKTVLRAGYGTAGILNEVQAIGQRFIADYQGT